MSFIPVTRIVYCDDSNCKCGGEYSFPWNPDPDDLLADDWEAL